MNAEDILTNVGENISKDILINCAEKIFFPTVFVGSRPSRGSKNDYPIKNDYLRIDVSSGSMKKLEGLYMKNLSPLILGPVYDLEDNEYVTFENLWQYNKVYPQLGHWDPISKTPTKKWYEWREKGMLKLKNGKGIRTPNEITNLKKTGSWKPIGAWWNNKLLDYIESRKQIYVPKYIEAIEKTNEYKVLKNMVNNKINILIIELDGPPLEEFPNGIPVNEHNIQAALHNEKYPYGHGYVLAGHLLNIKQT